MASAHLAAALSLFPGTYQIRVNNTDAAANVKAGATLELKPGALNVEAGTDEYYAVLDAARLLGAKGRSSVLRVEPRSPIREDWIEY